MKWSVKYQKKYGIDSGPAKDLAEAACDEIQHVCKRAYPRARAERLRADRPAARRRRATSWVLEANPNPQIAKGEDFAASAEKAGIGYEALLQRILNLGLRWQPESVA